MEESIYSNFDHVLNVSEINLMKQDGKEREHAALNFFGFIYYDKESELFIERIMRYHSQVAIIKHADIQDCIDEANERYGDD